MEDQKCQELGGGGGRWGSLGSMCLNNNVTRVFFQNTRIKNNDIDSHSIDNIYLYGFSGSGREGGHVPLVPPASATYASSIACPLEYISIVLNVVYHYVSLSWLWEAKDTYPQHLGATTALLCIY